MYALSDFQDTKGQMQSMNIFLRERRLSYGMRISCENFGGYDNIRVVPLYAASGILNPG